MPVPGVLEVAGSVAPKILGSMFGGRGSQITPINSSTNTAVHVTGGGVNFPSSDKTGLIVGVAIVALVVVVVVSNKGGG